MSLIAKTPKPPYYAVVFTSIRTEVEKGYAEMAEKMLRLARRQKGFLGVEEAHDRVGITISYWQDLDSIKRWKENAQHRVSQKNGRGEWYSSYKTRVCFVERDYGFSIES